MLGVRCGCRGVYGGGHNGRELFPLPVCAEGDGGELLPPKKGEAEEGSCFLPKGSGDTEKEHRKGTGDDSEGKLNPVSGTQHRKPFHEDFAHSFLSLLCSFQRFLLEIFPLSGPGLVLLQRFVVVGVSKARNE